MSAGVIHTVVDLMEKEDIELLERMRERLILDSKTTLGVLGVIASWTIALTFTIGTLFGLLESFGRLESAIVAFAIVVFFMFFMVKREKENLDAIGQRSEPPQKEAENEPPDIPPLSILEGAHPVFRSHYSIVLSGTLYRWSVLLAVPTILLIIIGSMSVWEEITGTSAFFNPVFWIVLGICFFGPIMFLERLKSSIRGFFSVKKSRVAVAILLVILLIAPFTCMEMVPHVNHVVNSRVRIVPYVEQGVRIATVDTSLDLLGKHLHLLWESEIIVDELREFPDDGISNYTAGDDSRIWGPALLECGMGTRAILRGEVVVYVTFLTGRGWDPDEDKHLGGLAKCGTNVAVFTASMSDALRAFEILLHEFGHIAGLDHYEAGPLMSSPSNPGAFIQTTSEIGPPFNDTTENLMMQLRNGTLESFYGAERIDTQSYNRSWAGTNQTTIRLSMWNRTLYFDDSRNQFHRVTYSYVSECGRFTFDCNAEERLQIDSYCPNVFLTAGSGSDDCYAWAPSELEYFGFR